MAGPPVHFYLLGCIFLVSLQHARWWFALRFIIFKALMLFRTKGDSFPMLELSKWTEVGLVFQWLAGSTLDIQSLEPNPQSGAKPPVRLVV